MQSQPHTFHVFSHLVRQKKFRAHKLILKLFSDPLSLQCYIALENKAGSNYKGKIRRYMNVGGQTAFQDSVLLVVV
jgi:hypothetical protein